MKYILFSLKFNLFVFQGKESKKDKKKRSRHHDDEDDRERRKRKKKKHSKGEETSTSETEEGKPKPAATAAATTSGAPSVCHFNESFFFAILILLKKSILTRIFILNSHLNDANNSIQFSFTRKMQLVGTQYFEKKINQYFNLPFYRLLEE